uniref:Uncharacterized protein n=1 Tax=Paramormyrops kingsleyae TaxID=1676925 RepID=A0A3B3QV31_9TELE
YLEEPDKSGHKFGPVSGGVIEAIQNMDRIIGQLMNGLKQMNLHRCVNIIIVADHGMEDTSCTQMEFLENMLGNVNDLFVYQGAFDPRSDITLVQDLSHHLCPHGQDFQCRKPSPKVRPFQKAHLPKRFHYASSRRIEDAIILVEPKWLACRAEFDTKDTSFPEFSVFFFSWKTDILEISPAQNNGTHGSLNHLLRGPWHVPQFPAEQTPPGTCPLLSLTPTDDLGCNCPSQVSPCHSSTSTCPCCSR